MGILVLGGALLEAFALLQVIQGGNDFIWRVAALALPLLVFCLLWKARGELTLTQETAPESPPGSAPSDLERKLAQLKDCPSVANKIAAADELMRCGRFDDAVPVYQSALTGIYRNEPDFLFKMAQAQIEANVPAAANTTVNRLMQQHARFRPEETRLLRARVLEGQGKIQEALSEYDSLTSAYVGLEAKCRFGLLLMREGQIERANEVFKQMVLEAEQSSYAMRVEHHWVRVAAHCQARLQSKLAPASGAR